MILNPGERLEGLSDCRFRLCRDGSLEIFIPANRALRGANSE